MKRILIIGSNGAGKSTFSFALAEKLNLPLIHIDQIYWHGNWEVTPPEDFQERLLQEVQKDEWIIEGNNVRSLDQRLRYADTVFWFEFPPLLCTKDIIRREVRYRGKARPDMPETCISKFQLSFLRYAWNFNKTYRERITKLLREAAHVDVIRFTNRRQVKKYLQKVL